MTDAQRLEIMELLRDACDNSADLYVTATTATAQQKAYGEMVAYNHAILLLERSDDA